MKAPSITLAARSRPAPAWCGSAFFPARAATVIGGTIENLSGTFLLEDGSLDGSGTHPITIVGQIAADDGATVDAAGAFKTNNSTLTLEPDTALLLGLSNVAAADTTFSGGGQIVMTAAAIDLNPLTRVGSVPPKLNNVDDTIEGSGTIGNPSSPGLIVLNNEAKGTVEAPNTAEPLTIYSNVINAGVLDAANGGFLILGGNAVTNTGSLRAEAGGEIALQDTTIHGGTLTGAGEFDIGGGAFDLDGAVLDGSMSMLTNASTIDMQTGLGLETRTLTLEGTINNTGTMEMGTSGTGGAGTFAGPIPIGSIW